MSCICQDPEATQVTENGIVYCETIDTLPPSCEPKSCPPNYELVDGECVRNFDTGQLCPEDYIYIYDEEQPSNSRCVFYEESLAACTCAANVTAQPQTICSGGVTSIALTSTSPGTVFSWTANPSGVTGATQGSGNTISQTLQTTGVVQGTVSYVITPYEPGDEGCAGTPITVLATVNPLPSISAIPVSPQTVTSGDTLNIALSSGVVGTTFTWTATASGVTGATSGSGNTITDTLTSPTGGSVTYDIVATSPNGCTNTLAYTVNLGTTVVECLRDLTARVFYDDQPQFSVPYSTMVISIAGTSGSGIISIDGTGYPITFTTDAATTALNFRNAHFAALDDAGTIVGNAAVNIALEKNDIAPIVFAFSNTTGNLLCSIAAQNTAIKPKMGDTFATIALLPTTGIFGRVYITTSTSQTWCWSGTTYVPSASKGVTVNPTGDTAFNPVSSTIDHTCSRAKYNFMTNGLAINCYHYPPSSSILPTPLNVKTLTNYINLNNLQAVPTPGLDEVNRIVYNRFTSPSAGKAGSRESFAEYSNAQSAILAQGLSPSANTFKIRLRGLNIVTNPVGLPAGTYYSQHSSVVGLQFFIDGVEVYEGVIGSQVFEIDPCTFVPGEPLLTYESSTGGTGRISKDITIGTQTGTLAVGVPVTANTVTQNITVNVTLLGTYDFIGYANGVTFRAKGTFASLGANTITMTALGTPITSGVSTFELDLAVPVAGQFDWWHIPPTFNITVL